LPRFLIRIGGCCLWSCCERSWVWRSPHKNTD